MFNERSLVQVRELLPTWLGVSQHPKPETAVHRQGRRRRRRTDHSSTRARELWPPVERTKSGHPGA